MVGTQQRISSGASWTLDQIRDEVESMFGSAHVLPSGWHVRDVRRQGAAAVQLELGPASGKSVLLEWHERGDQPIPAFLEGPRYAVAYGDGPNAWPLDDPETPADLKSSMARACELLALPPRAVSLTQAMPERRAAAREVPFTPARFQEWAAGFLRPGTDVSDGWRVEKIVPYGPEEMTVFLARAGEMYKVEIKVRLRQDDLDAAERTSTLDVFYRTPEGRRADASREQSHARTARAVAVLLRSHERDLRFIPDPLLALAQTCEEGAVSACLPDLPGHAAGWVPADVMHAVIEGAAAGGKILRLMGGEPLRAPWTADLIRAANDAGFRRVDISTSLADLADAALAARVVEHIPGDFRFIAPLQGADAESHDLAVGRAGDFEAQLAALQNLRPLLEPDGRGAVVMRTTLTPETLERAPAIAALVRRLGVAWGVALAEPPPTTPVKRYRAEVVSMTDAVAAMYPQDAWIVAPLAPAALTPCVALAHQERSGHRLITVESLDARYGMKPPPGPRTTCPGEEHCALAGVCPRSVAAVYADETGLQELQPVRPEQLSALPDADAIASFLRRVPGDHHASFQRRT